MRSDDAYKACVRILEAAGIPHEIEQSKRHVKVVFTHCGRRCEKILSRGGHRTKTADLAAADIRRLMRDAERQSGTPERAHLSKGEPAPAPSQAFGKDETMESITGVAIARTIQFRDNPLESFERDGETCVVLKPIVDGMGLDWEGQRQRTERHPVLGPSTFVIKVQVGGQRRDALCLPLRFLNGFLFGIESSRVRADMRERVVAYQRECFEVLANYWLKGEALRAEPLLTGGDQIDSIRRIDGISKMLSHKVTGIEKRVEDIAAAQELILEHLAHPLVAVSQSSLTPPKPPVTAYEVVVDLAEVPKVKRFGGLPAQVSARLSRHCARHGYQVGILDMHPGEKLTFPRSAADEWLAAGGRTIIWDLAERYAAKKRGTSPVRVVG